MYSSPVFSTISILVLIYTWYNIPFFFYYEHTCFNMVFHAADIQGVYFSIIIPVKRLKSCTDKSRERENGSTVQ